MKCKAVKTEPHMEIPDWAKDMERLEKELAEAEDELDVSDLVIDKLQKALVKCKYEKLKADEYIKQLHQILAKLEFKVAVRDKALEGLLADRYKGLPYEDVIREVEGWIDQAREELEKEKND